jgi:TPR repeat protein
MRKRVLKTRKRRPSSSLLFAEANQLWDAGDERKAFQTFLRAATEGHASAKNSVGYFLDHGIGTKKNATRAMDWYRRAA